MSYEDGITHKPGIDWRIDGVEEPDFSHGSSDLSGQLFPSY